MPSPKVLAAWYPQLAQLLDAGISLPDAWETAHGPPLKDRQAMALAWRQGRTVDEILGAAPAWLPPSDRLLLSAAAESGRLPQICRDLARQHEQTLAIRQQVMGTLMYPLLILHMAALLVPVTAHLNLSLDHVGPPFDQAGWLRDAGLHLLFLWPVLGTIALLVQRSPVWFCRFLDWVPGVCGYRKARAQARFTDTLHGFLMAGVRIGEALGGAALVSGDPILERRILAIMPRVQGGQPAGPLLAATGQFAADYTARYLTAEQTGMLDRTLPLLTEEAQARARARLQQAAFWYPKILFFALALYIGFGMARAYANYLQGVLSLT